MLRIVLDTNTLVSAIGWKGKPREILLDCAKGKHQLIESGALLAEIKLVLKRPKFNFIAAHEINEFFLILSRISLIVIPREEIGIITDDPSDNRVLECAVAGNAEYIISGDAHLLKLRNFHEIQIVTANEFLEIGRPF